MKHRIKFLSTAATLSIIFRFVWLKLCSIHFESVYLFFYCFLLFIDMERSIWDFSTSVAIGQTKLQTKKTMYFAKFAKSDSECNLFGSIFYALRIVVDEWNRHGTTAQLRTANLNVKRCFDSIRHIPCTTLEKFFSLFLEQSVLCAAFWHYSSTRWREKRIVHCLWQTIDFCFRDLLRFCHRSIDGNRISVQWKLNVNVNEPFQVI